jgi:hypothetical protein
VLVCKRGYASTGRAGEMTTIGPCFMEQARTVACRTRVQVAAKVKLGINRRATGRNLPSWCTGFPPLSCGGFEPKTGSPGISILWNTERVCAMEQDTTHASKRQDPEHASDATHRDVGSADGPYNFM